MPWSPAGNICVHFHLDSPCLEGVTDAPDPQCDSNHFNSSQNIHLAIIFPRVCVFGEHLSHITEQNSESALSYSF